MLRFLRFEIVTSRGTVKANRVVIASNAWAADLFPELKGVIRPVRGQCVATEPITWTKVDRYILISYLVADECSPE